MSNEEKLLRAFWHKSRKTWVPLTDYECNARSGTDSAIRQQALKSGLLSVEKRDQKKEFSITIYEITKSGKNTLRQIDMNK